MSVWRGCGGTGRCPHSIEEGGPWGKHGFPHGTEPKARDAHGPRLRTSGSDRGDAPAELPGCERSCPGDDAVPPAGVAQVTLDLERAARRPRRPDSAETDDAVLAEHDAPPLPDPVLIHLELRLDAPVVELQLQLPGAGAGASPALDHLPVVPTLRARGRSHGEGQGCDADDRQCE